MKSIFNVAGFDDIRLGQRFGLVRTNIVSFEGSLLKNTFNDVEIPLRTAQQMAQGCILQLINYENENHPLFTFYFLLSYWLWTAYFI